MENPVRLTGWPADSQKISEFSLFWLVQEKPLISRQKKPPQNQGFISSLRP
jgi:hypothetical protein